MQRQLNGAWHDLHRMKKNSTMDERVAWHLEHARKCGCRKIPLAIQKEINSRNEAKD